MAIQIQYRRGLASAWTSANPVLAEGEPGYEKDTGKFKVGDGVLHWNSLVYSSGIKGDTGDPGVKGDPGTTDYEQLINKPDLTTKVDKVTGKSLVSDTEIAKIHASGSDNQDLSGKVDKISGKGLSTNDYTDAEESKLAGIEAGAQVNANITKGEIEAKLTGEIDSHSHAGGGGLSQQQIEGLL
jgi:hypothetical protein